MKAIIYKNGQVTIPKLIRDNLGIQPGQVLDFRVEHGRLVATKAILQDEVESLYGILRLGRSTNALMKTLRGRMPRCKPTDC